MMVQCLCLILVISSSFVNGQPKPPEDPSNPPLFQSSPAEIHHDSFLEKIMDIILNDGLFKSGTPDLIFEEPKILVYGFSTILTEEGTPLNLLLEMVKYLFSLHPQPGHKYVFNRRIGGLDPLAIAGDWLAATMSNLVVTYLVAPIWTVMEIKMTEYLSSNIGWSERGAGIPTSGCGAANSMALAIAIQKMNPVIRDIGLFYPTEKLLLLVSTHAPITWETAAIYQGIGTDNIRKIPVGTSGQMDIDALRETLSAIQDGSLPGGPYKAAMIVGTAGTPVFGVTDDLNEIAKLAKQYNVWFHVDAEKGGGHLFLARGHHSLGSMIRLPGIDKADSVTVGTWLLATPSTSSMLLTRDPNALFNAFGLHAPYVFTGIDMYNMTYDQGDNTIQTSRRPEIAKIWFAALRGEESIAANLKHQYKLRDSILKQIEEKSNFYLVQPQKSSCAKSDGPFYDIDFRLPLASFYYEPESMRGIEDKSSRKYLNGMKREMEKLRIKLLEIGAMDLSLSYHPEHTNCTTHPFLTISLNNNKLDEDDFHYVFKMIEKVGEGAHALVLPPYSALESNLKFPNYPLKSIYGDFMANVLKLFRDKGIFFKRSSRPSNFMKPEELMELFPFSLPPKSSHISFEELLKQFEHVITYSPHWAHPYFIYQLAAGLDPFTLAADYIVPVLNTPMISYVDSTTFALMEEELVKQMLMRVYGSEEGDGIITDGGSMANQIAVALARQWINPDIRSVGYNILGGRRLLVYTSVDAHYSTKKGSIIEGIGQNNTIEIESYSNGIMRVDKLIEAIEKAKSEDDIPLMVVITTGTTIYGAIDPIEDIVNVCHKYVLWCHVDGMFGGLMVLSDNAKIKLKGIEGVDSFGADLHKLFGSTMVCTILISNHKNIFKDTFGLTDRKHEEPIEYSQDRLGKHWQTDKRNNMFKFWFLWKAKGRIGLGQHVDLILDNAQYLVNELTRRRNEGFQLVLPKFQLTNVCFRFIPLSVGEGNHSEDDRLTIMNAAQFQLERDLLKNGVMNIVAQDRHELSGKIVPKFLKFVMMGSALNRKDIDYLLDAILYYGNNITPESRTKLIPEINHKHFEPFNPWGNMPKYHPPTWN